MVLLRVTWSEGVLGDFLKASLVEALK